MHNPHLKKLTGNYIFAEMERLIEGKDLINLGIGDTTRPLPTIIANRMAAYAKSLATSEGYSGYGTSQGNLDLREKISMRFYNGQIDPDEIFISDGAKPDLARLQFLFHPDATVALQDPAYPVYIETSQLAGHKVVQMPCTPENDFFPETFPNADIFFICSPNNPTGTIATPRQLTRLVKHAQETEATIIFDSAYAAFTQGVHSIFEIEGARDVAIEMSSFSKLAGFTGLRLGWTVVPKGRFHTDWKRLTDTLFNGASKIIQEGGLACLEDEGWNEVQELISYYLENARLLKEALSLPCYGGTPYIWADFGIDSWKAFEMLTQQGMITTPGSSFGPSGKGFVRFSSFAKRKDVLLAAEKLKCLQAHQKTAH